MNIVNSNFERNKIFGVRDGVAGSWIVPEYIRRKPIRYTPGSKQHLENVALQLKRSIEEYKKELETSYVPEP